MSTNKPAAGYARYANGHANPASIKFGKQSNGSQAVSFAIATEEEGLVTVYVSFGAVKNKKTGQLDAEMGLRMGLDRMRAAGWTGELDGENFVGLGSVKCSLGYREYLNQYGELKGSWEILTGGGFAAGQEMSQPEKKNFLKQLGLDAKRFGGVKPPPTPAATAQPQARRAAPPPAGDDDFSPGEDFYPD